MNSLAHRASLIHPSIQKALAHRSGSNKSIKLTLIKGAVPSQEDLRLALFPPRGMHANSFPATFGFDLGSGVRFDLHLMVNLIAQNHGAEVTVLGFISHDQNQELFKEVDINGRHLYAAAQFWPVTGEGFVSLSKVAHGVIRASKAAELATAETLRQRVGRRHEQCMSL